MAKAAYDKLEDGKLFRKNPAVSRCLAFAETLYKCEAGIEVGLGGLADCKIRHGDTLPVIRKIDLNVKMPE